jgi:integrase
LFTEASGGWTLHQLRHSALTHLAEDGVAMALLKAKSRHASLRSLERYVRPSDASVAKLTAQHDRARRR